MNLGVTVPVTKIAQKRKSRKDAFQKLKYQEDYTSEVMLMFLCTKTEAVKQTEEVTGRTILCASSVPYTPPHLCPIFYTC